MAAGEPQWWYDHIARQAAAESILRGEPSPTWARQATDRFFQSHFTDAPMTIPFKRLHPAAKCPAQAKPGDAGYDLYALDDPATHDSRPLHPGERRFYSTGIALAIPPGYYGRIAPRSGLAVKEGLDVMAGVCDAGYRGPVSVLLVNLGQDPVWVKPGQRIAQLIVERCHEVAFNEVKELDQSDRGAAGFGSTGGS